MLALRALPRAKIPSAKCLIYYVTDPKMNSVLAQELRRKFFHAFSALYAVLFVLAGRSVSLWVIGVLLVIVGLLEAVRLRNPIVNDRFVRLFHGIHREKEKNQPSGILWTLAGSFATIAFIPHPDIVITALGYLALGDGVAALVGRPWGRVRFGSKSLEGSLACFLVCWIVGSLCLRPPFGSLEVLWGALTATLLEALPLPLNDNFWLPLLSGLVLAGVRHFS